MRIKELKFSSYQEYAGLPKGIQYIHIAHTETCFNNGENTGTCTVLNIPHKIECYSMKKKNKLKTIKTTNLIKD